MGKKGSWFSAIKRVFTHSSKEKVPDGTEKKSTKEKKKKGFGKLKHGDGHSFIPLFREPSSIEEILGEAEREREHHIRNYRPLTTPEHSKLLPVRNASVLKAVDVTPTAPSPLKDAFAQRYATQTTPKREGTPSRGETLVNEATSGRTPSPRRVREWRPEPTLKNRHICATKIQTAFRGYAARKSYGALRGLMRLQGVVKGQSVKRQTANALKCMQMLVRVQTQIQARRILMLENQALQRQSLNRNGKDLQSAFTKWMSENQENWDDSTLTKEEIETRMQRKFDAIVKRERAMAYAYSNQSWKSTPRIGHGALADFRTGGYPYWWNWLEQRQPMTPSRNLQKSPTPTNFHLTPTRPITDFKASPFPQSINTNRPSPLSTRSTVPAGTSGTFRDTDSLTSCPTFSVPRYMTPTVSAQAKSKDGKEHFPTSPGSITSDVSKRRSSFPFSQGPKSFKWNKTSLFSNKKTSSVGNLSIDSSTSMPASVGRQPFNRFV